MLHPGEALYALPGCYISGFCLGWTLIESIAVALRDWTSEVECITKFNVEYKLPTTFDADWVMAEEMRCKRTLDLESEAQEPGFAAFTTMVQRVECSIESVKHAFPAFKEMVCPPSFGIDENKCDVCGAVMELVYVTDDRPFVEKYCLDHHQKAMDGKMGPPRIYLPKDWDALKEWAGVEDKGM